MGALKEGVGRRIQHLRKSARLTQEQLASKAGIDAKYLGSLERGEKGPSFEVLERLVLALQVEPFEPFLFSMKRGREKMRTSQDALLSLVRRTDAPTQALLIHLIQVVLEWANDRKP